MDKQSYVVLEHIFQVQASQLYLCSFRSGSCAYDSRLDAQSYILLMGRLILEPEDWVLTMLLKLGITSPRETPRRQSRTFGNQEGFVAQPLPQQSLRVDHPPVAATDRVFLSQCRHTEEIPLPTNSMSSRMPGVYHQQSASRDSYNGYRRSGQCGRVPPPEDNGEDAKVPFKGLIVLLAAASFIWWRWRSK
jgi:hypothetical protein